MQYSERRVWCKSQGIPPLFTTQCIQEKKYHIYPEDDPIGGHDEEDSEELDDDDDDDDYEEEDGREEEDEEERKEHEEKGEKKVFHGFNGLINGNDSYVVLLLK